MDNLAAALHTLATTLHWLALLGTACVAALAVWWLFVLLGWPATVVLAPALLWLLPPRAR